MSSHVFLVFLVGIACVVEAQYVIDTNEGCADIAVELPANYSVVRVDNTDYIFNGVDTCVNFWNPTDTMPCEMTEADGIYVALTTVCNVEKHTWVGFRMDEYLQDGRWGYVAVYFSHGGSWTGIEKYCVQPQDSTEAVIDAAGQTEVEITCARIDDCPMGPVTSIMIATRDLCRDYAEPACMEEVKDDKTLLSTTFKRPEGEDVSWVFCTTNGAYLSYKVNWE